jgi:hypothetical protein
MIPCEKRGSSGRLSASTNRGRHDVVTEWEAEHGALSDDELAAARRLIDG